MGIINIKHAKLNGSIDIQISKSDAHRSLIAAALCHDDNRTSMLSPWQDNVGIDIAITKNALETLGFCQFNDNGNGVLEVISNSEYNNNATVDMGESGTSMRFFVPIVASQNLNTTLLGKGRLLKRPMGVYQEIWAKLGLEFIQNEEHIKTSGQLPSGEYTIDGGVSSQFISAMIFGLSTQSGDSTLNITGKLESKPYIDMTINTLRKFGVSVIYKDERTIFINGGQKYKATNVELDRDWSHAAFFVSAAALGGKIKLLGLDRASLQGDKAIIDIVENMGANVVYNTKNTENGKNSITVENNGRLRGIDIDIANIPDLAPIVSLLGVYASGKTKLYNAQRLRYKESDRITDLANMLTSLGANIETSDSEIIIHGKGYLEGGHTNAYNDHRLAMTAAMASIISNGDITLEGYESVAKSSKNFFTQFTSLGGITNGKNMAI